VHRRDRATDELADAILRYALERTRLDPPPLDHPVPPERLRAEVGETISAGGMGGERALRAFVDIIAPACISIDHPRFLSFVPAAPTEAAVLFDLVVGASSIYAGSWLEGGGAVWAENEALRWLADLAGFPPEAGGVFVSGGSAGNLSALVTARHRWRAADRSRDRLRGLVIVGAGAHSSVASACRVMDVDVIAAAGDDEGRFTGAALAGGLRALAPGDGERVFATVATGGTTNSGMVDDLASVADVAAEHDLWFHVDAAYGGAALCAPSARGRFVGIERADSYVVDPHKWLFAPFDCAALVYRDPAMARAAHTQHAAYLAVLTGGADWNPADYAFHLSRRARGLPFWFSLATHGTDAYADAVEQTLATTAAGAALIRHAEHLELLTEPELSVLLFRRVGWEERQYAEWSERMLYSGVAFVTPTTHHDAIALRLCIVNPRTTEDDIRVIIDSLR
jgi:glutamate/tyrosine decarboxylase-like PLP-dependent enzyme